ncbi:deoxyguanosinetriphosphate triphosphohydrolase [Afifella sp. IM 167]|uniref:deoxyguanosinetriphosphate triphosphohydrolase n=1 Tax=Afifella sp. IM 167 TaxID=2033586 RepID=UPI001CCB9603|nr:deoxyguanosinetriphosphate triphosphohydrolase [Afifella sp. IM 167]MBZ8132564.1 deoxyguanosinetriphosphate triphosphohydrolase [Afifella sp. IM 167]
MTRVLPEHLLRGGARWRAPYAADLEAGARRVHEEAADPLRSPFQRDRDRIVHSTAFRRLKHKTQVFVRPEGDHFRTRLTHSLEVAQVARSIARPLGLDEDLTEAIALAHDLGHSPFGHAGERALAEVLGAHGGFDHNVQSIRVVTELERRYPRFDGLNLSLGTLDGLIKHNGPYRNDEPPAVVAGLHTALALDLTAQPPGEAQVAAIADDIAYDAHDIDDGLRAGLLALDDLREVELTAGILAAIEAEYPDLEPSRQAAELVRRLITVMIFDVIAETATRLEDGAVGTPEAVAAAPSFLVGFSAEVASKEKELKRFLFARLYRHPEVMARVEAGGEVIRSLFARFTKAPQLLPAEWQTGLGEGDDRRLCRRVGDYIAGMTDGYALAEHRRLFDRTPDLG